MVNINVKKAPHQSFKKKGINVGPKMRNVHDINNKRDSSHQKP